VRKNREGNTRGSGGNSVAGIFDDRTDTERTRQALTQTKKNKIKAAVGYKCEKCGKKFPQRNLKVHHIEEASKASGSKDLNTPSNLLVLCSICHDDVHHKPIVKSTQKGWIKKRPESVKKEIRSILRNRQKVNDSNSSPVRMRTPKISQPKIKPVKIDMPDFSGLGGSKKKNNRNNDLDVFFKGLR